MEFKAPNTESILFEGLAFKKQDFLSHALNSRLKGEVRNELHVVVTVTSNEKNQGNGKTRSSITGNYKQDSAKGGFKRESG